MQYGMRNGNLEKDGSSMNRGMILQIQVQSGQQYHGYGQKTEQPTQQSGQQIHLLRLLQVQEAPAAVLQAAEVPEFSQKKRISP